MPPRSSRPLRVIRCSPARRSKPSTSTRRGRNEIAAGWTSVHFRPPSVRSRRAERSFDRVRGGGALERGGERDAVAQDGVGLERHHRVVAAGDSRVADDDGAQRAALQVQLARGAGKPGTIERRTTVQRQPVHLISRVQQSPDLAFPLYPAEAGWSADGEPRPCGIERERVEAGERGERCRVPQHRRETKRVGADGIAKREPASPVDHRDVGSDHQRVHQQLAGRRTQRHMQRVDPDGIHGAAGRQCSTETREPGAVRAPLEARIGRPGGRSSRGCRSSDRVAASRSVPPALNRCRPSLVEPWIFASSSPSTASILRSPCSAPRSSVRSARPARISSWLTRDGSRSSSSRARMLSGAVPSADAERVPLSRVSQAGPFRAALRRRASPSGRSARR